MLEYKTRESSKRPCEHLQIYVQTWNEQEEVKKQTNKQLRTDNTRSPRKADHRVVKGNGDEGWELSHLAVVFQVQDFRARGKLVIVQ